MELNIMGSAGANVIPRPFCNCDVCLEAKRKGRPHKRRSTSIFFREMHSLFEFPCDLRYSLNRDMALLIDNIFISSLNLESLDGLRFLRELVSLRVELNGKRSLSLKKLRLFVPISFKNNPMISWWLEGFKRVAVFEIVFLEPNIAIEIERIRIIPMEISRNGDLAFLISKGSKVMLMALHTTRELGLLDSALGLVEKEYDIKRISLLVTRQPFILPKSAIRTNFFNGSENTYYSAKEMFLLIKRFNIKRTLFLLIEECFGLSHDDYKRLEEVYKEYRILFGYDGLNVKV